MSSIVTVLNPYSKNKSVDATTIDFSIPMQSSVAFTIYNILGEEMYSMVDENLSSGTYHVRWDGKNKFGVQVPSGVYFYQLNAGDGFTQTKKMTLLK